MTSYIFGLLAGATSLITYLLYFKQILKGQSTPNPSTWLIWVLIGIINAFTFFTIVHEHWWQSCIVIVGAASVFIIFVYSALKGKFSKISHTEIVIFILAIIIGLYWQLTSNDRLANLLLQFIYVISFVPTITAIIKGRTKEYAIAWIIGAVAHIFATVSLLAESQTDWVPLVHTVLNGIIANSLIVVLIIIKSRKITSTNNA